MDNHESRIKGTVAGTALLLVLLLPAACSPRIIREVITETHTVVRDSTIWRDTTIRVPIPLEKDQAIVTLGDTSELETSIARSTAYIDSTGRLKHALENKRGQIETTVKIPARMIWTNVTSNKAEILKQEVKVEKPLSWWQNFRMVLGTIAIFATLLILAAWAVKKFILKL